MNILFFGRRAGQESPGVLSKIDGQIAALRALGHTVYYTDMANGGWALFGGKEGPRPLSPHPLPLPAALRPHLDGMAALEGALKTGPDFQLLYVRKPLVDAALLRALDKAKAAGSKVVLELPTYPYDKELEGQKTAAARVFLAIDRRYRKRLCGRVDLMATLSDEDEIFGVKTVYIQNAVQAAQLAPHGKKANAEGPLVLLMVSTMGVWHGADRLLAGLAAYFAKGGEQSFRLLLVGDGPQRAALEKQAATSGLAGCVAFPGVQTGTALDALFAQSDLAVSTLALHRKGIQSASSLKSCEYAARGIPFAYAGEDTIAAQIPWGCLQLPGDDSPVDFTAVLRFYKGLPPDCGQSMRAFAQKELGWERQMQKVLNACFEL